MSMALVVMTPLAVVLIFINGGFGDQFASDDDAYEVEEDEVVIEGEVISINSTIKVEEDEVVVEGEAISINSTIKVEEDEVVVEEEAISINSTIKVEEDEVVVEGEAISINSTIEVEEDEDGVGMAIYLPRGQSQVKVPREVGRAMEVEEEREFVYGLVTITDPKMIDDLQSELDERRLKLVAVQSFASATKAKSTEVVALLSILASELDFLIWKWEVLDLARA
ncbi:hypothetical protein F0562_019428 [Nyssa sinensis]|uniref:Uncharacterized protein n=1 Tax=Nyssa sinensis TaxID=561372 RepID=A0A5J5BPS1_9ASTE|nr:hypothetical protein F0562_019428 [Nyssa sinensis]